MKTKGPKQDRQHRLRSHMYTVYIYIYSVDGYIHVHYHLLQTCQVKSNM